MPKQSKPSPALAKLTDAVAALAKIEARREALLVEHARLLEARARACADLEDATRGTLDAFAKLDGELLVAPPPAPGGTPRRSNGAAGKLPPPVDLPPPTRA